MFFDKYAVGVNVYNLEGRLLTTKITRGRQNNEMQSTTWIAGYDSTRHAIVLMDKNSRFHIYDSNWKKVYSSSSPWYLYDSSFDQLRWKMLYNHPDAETIQMYEYNFDCRRLLISNNKIFLPIRTEHINFNGYSKAGARKEYWHKSHTILSIDSTGNMMLIGSYPDVYLGRKNIPVFANYDLANYAGTIVVSYSADHTIYEIDSLGMQRASFGVKDPYISCRYPSTSSFDEYEDSYDKHHEKFGYYSRIATSRDILLRTLKRDNGQWVVQVYKDRKHIGNITTENEIEILGETDGFWYAVIEPNYRKELMQIIRFSIYTDQGQDLFLQ